MYFFLSEMAVEYTTLGKVADPRSTACTEDLRLCDSNIQALRSLSPGGVFSSRSSLQER